MKATNKKTVSKKAATKKASVKKAAAKKTTAKKSPVRKSTPSNHLPQVVRYSKDNSLHTGLLVKKTATKAIVITQSGSGVRAQVIAGNLLTTLSTEDGKKARASIIKYGKKVGITKGAADLLKCKSVASPRGKSSAKPATAKKKVTAKPASATLTPAASHGSVADAINKVTGLGSVDCKRGIAYHFSRGVRVYVSPTKGGTLSLTIAGGDAQQFVRVMPGDDIKWNEKNNYFRMNRVSLEQTIEMLQAIEKRVPQAAK